ncbi:MAG: rhomboid family intramembrane serine protease [Planctomycetes bacterium]|nr:rhomboid family intramembrane serine protease [Planctomycetota bacterium]
MTRTYEDPPEFRESAGPSFGYPRLTPVVRWVIWLNVGVFVALLIAGFAAPKLEAAVYGALRLDPAAWSSDFPLAPWWQVITYGFLHSMRDPMHILMNLLGVYFFGTLLENQLGSKRFATLYGLALAIGATLHLAIACAGDWNVTVVGASGGVMAVVVAAAVLYPNMRVIFFVFPMPLKVLALIFVGLDLFRVLTQQSGGVASIVHLAGAAWGFAALKFGWIWADPAARWQERQERKVVEQRQTDEERLDKLLQQIHDKGMPSLSSSDREFLKRMSSRR